MERQSGEPTVITQRKLLLVEGMDEVSFFTKLLEHLCIKDCQIAEVAGKHNFADRLPVLVRTPGFSDPSGPCVTHLAIVRDQDNDDAFVSVRKIVEDNKLVPPERVGTFGNGRPLVGIFIMPGCKVEGTMLEDLCLQSVAQRPAMRCVDSFSDCVSTLDSAPRIMSKARALVYLAAQREVVNTIGLGAQKGYWDFDAPCMDGLKAFLKHLC